MVHALEKIHRLLKRDGALIDIHPTGELATLEVRVGAQTTLAGWWHEPDVGLEYVYAGEALARVVESGLFATERQGVFEYITHADTLAELRDSLTDGWEDATVDALTVGRIEEMLNTHERDKEVLLREKVRITRLCRR